MKLAALVAVLAAAPVRAQDAPPAPAAPPAPTIVIDRSAAHGEGTTVVAPRNVRGSVISMNGYTVPAGDVVDGEVVVPFGDVRVVGEVTGDVTVGKGDLIVEPTGVIHGDAVVTGGGRLVNQGGKIYGEMRVNSPDDARRAARDRGAEARGHGARATEAIRFSGGSWYGSMREGAEGLISTLTLGILFCLFGAGLVFYARPQFERVSATLRVDTFRSALIGIIANFLSVPAFLIGIVLLAITIIGIPVLILYIPLFWVVVMAAAGYGVLAVAHAIGERTAEQSGSFAAARRNAYTYVFTGIGVLLAPLFVAHLLELTGFLGWLGDLVEILGGVILWGAATVGFGAVFLTRGGTRPGWPWKRPMPYDPIFDEEPAFYREEPAGV